MSVEATMGKLVSIVEEPQRLTLGVQITFAILTTVAVTLRLIARQTKGVGTQWDDYLIVVALVRISCEYGITKQFRLTIV